MNYERVEYLLQFLSEEPDDVFLNYSLALEYIKAGKEREAVDLLRKVISINDKYLAAYYQLAKLLEKINPVECVTIYAKGIEMAKAMKDIKTANELTEAYNLFREDED
jgi:tetratricopeptide (TPR) repeat protein